MYVRGKDTAIDKERRFVDSLTLREQKNYYFQSKSWLAYYKVCFELGELTEQECIKLRQEVLFGKAKNAEKNSRRSFQ